MEKLKILNLLFLLIGLAVIQSCYYDDPPPIQPIDPADVSYSTHIQPIFNSSCATSSCHDGTTAPNLLTASSWTDLRKGGYINTSVPEESSLYKAVAYLPKGVPMPPGGPQISELNQLLILAWIQNGAPND